MKEFKRDRKEYHAVGKCIPKKDSDQVSFGKASIHQVGRNLCRRIVS